VPTPDEKLGPFILAGQNGPGPILGARLCRVAGVIVAGRSGQKHWIARLTRLVPSARLAIRRTANSPSAPLAEDGTLVLDDDAGSGERALNPTNSKDNHQGRKSNGLTEYRAQIFHRAKPIVNRRGKTC